MALRNPINREVVRLAVPSILANITVPLVGIVDTAIAGHLGDAALIGTYANVTVTQAKNWILSGKLVQ